MVVLDEWLTMLWCDMMMTEQRCKSATATDMRWTPNMCRPWRLRDSFSAVATKAASEWRPWNCPVRLKATMAWCLAAEPTQFTTGFITS